MADYNRELEELFTRAYQRAYRAAKSICLNRHLAEDAVSEAAVRMLDAMRRGSVRADADAYFIRIAVNEAKRICMKRREIPTDDIAAYLDACGIHTEFDSEAAKALLEAVNRLGEKLRIPIQLHYFGGFSEAETARSLGISYSAVKARIMRGRKKLKEMLSWEENMEGGVSHEI